MFSRKKNAAVHCRAVALLWLCLAAGFLGSAQTASAQNPNTWQVQSTIPSLANGNTYVLWVESGTTLANGTYSGDMACIWTVDVTGHRMAASPTYGPYAGWRAGQIAPAFDGTLRMAWTRDIAGDDGINQDILSFWVLDNVANRMYISPTYGPYSGQHFLEFFPNPDGTSSLYWGKTTYVSGSTMNGTQLSIWAVDAVGSRLSVSPAYGIYPNWFFYEALPSFNRNGTNFIVWFSPGTTGSGGSYSGDRVAIWKTDMRGTRTSISPTYGPYPGWHFSELFPAYDGTARVLWTVPGTTLSSGTYSGDTASVWAVDETGSRTAVSPTYGPYAGWTVNSIIPTPSSTSRLLWVLPGTTDSSGNVSSDQASIWSLNAVGVRTSISNTYSDGTGATVDSLTALSDGSEHLIWESGSDSTQFSVWSLDASNNQIMTGPTYGFSP